MQILCVTLNPFSGQTLLYGIWLYCLFDFNVIDFGARVESSNKVGKKKILLWFSSPLLLFFFFLLSSSSFYFLLMRFTKQTFLGPCKVCRSQKYGKTSDGNYICEFGHIHDDFVDIFNRNIFSIYSYSFEVKINTSTESVEKIAFSEIFKMPRFKK